MKWLIMYADGSVFSSDDGEPWEAPTQGVEMVYNANPSVGFKTEDSPRGFWGWRDDYGWLGFRNDAGFWDYMYQTGFQKYPIFGRTLRDEAWHEIRKLAGEKAMGLQKSGWWRSEREDLEP